MPEPETTPLSAGGDSAAALLAVVDAYLEEIRQGKAPDRAAVLAAHPELAPQLESCLAALDFIHRTEHTDPAVPPTLGDFRIVREIGRGAMGVVYEAEQISLKRKVALKVLRFGAAPDAEAMARFRREAETVAGLHHTNIVPLFAVGCEAGVDFFAMQLIPGRSLAAVLEEANTAGRPLEAKKVVGWGVHAAEALAHAHARGVVHRDVKPSNLLLDEEGTVWLTDFGLARRRDEATLTVAGVQLGTPRYMSPEQAAAAQNPVDQRSDVYSLGATLYELATGKPVFDAPTTGQLFEQIAQAEPVPPRRHRKDLPRDLETVLLRCLAKHPAQRYATARDLADDLRRVAAGDPVKARRPGLLLRLRRWAAQRGKPAVRVAAVAVLAVVATLVLVMAGQAWWHADREARKGAVTLQVEGGPMRGEVFSVDGKPVVSLFTLPTPTPIELPGGWYRLRVTRPGVLSEDYELFIEQGRQRSFTVGSNDRQLWEPMPIEGTVAGDFGVLHIGYQGPGSTLHVEGSDWMFGEIHRLEGNFPGTDVELVVPPFKLPTRKPIALPELLQGWYQLRVVLPDGRSVKHDFWSEPDRQLRLIVSSDGKVSSPPPDVVIKQLGKPAKESKEFAKWSQYPFVPADRWELKLTPQDHSFSEDLWPFVWKKWPTMDRAPPKRQLLQPAPDLDGDGVADLVFACDREGLGLPGFFGEPPLFVLAISGKDGKLLWCRELHSNVFLTQTETLGWLVAERESLSVLSLVRAIPGVMIPAPPLGLSCPPLLYKETATKLAGPPFVVADIDGDGHPDLIVAHGAFSVLVNDPERQKRRSGVIRPCVEAFSGRTGATLWRHESPSLAERFVMHDDEAANRRREEVAKGDFSNLWKREPLTGFASFAERKTDRGRILLAGLFPGLERLDLRTGKAVAPPDPPVRDEGLLARETVVGGHVRAWSADGSIAIVSRFWPHFDGGHLQTGLRFAGDVTPMDTASGKDLARRGKFFWPGDNPGVFADLDGDGVPDMIMADQLVDGATGKLRKRQAVACGVPLVGPDFDGDGWRDLFVVEIADGERYGHPPGVKVLLARLCSGKDDRPLWLTAEPIGKGECRLDFREPKERREDFAGAVFYWRSTPGAAGHFVVNVNRRAGERVAFLFAADTGRLEHVWPEVTVEGVADLDGDGFLDLYGRHGEQLVTVRGTAPEQWRRPGRWRWQWLKGAFTSFGSGSIECCTNGPTDNDGKDFPTYLTGPVPHADLDGDGVADVLRFTFTTNWSTWPCEAYSGRDGRLLWVQSISLGSKGPAWVECLDLEGKKRPVVVVWSKYEEWGGSKGSDCALLDGRTGKLRWKKTFPGEPRPELRYRQADGRLALVYRLPDDKKGDRSGTLVPVDADGEELVTRTPIPAGDDEKEERFLPRGLECLYWLSHRMQDRFPAFIFPHGPADKKLWRFDGWGEQRTCTHYWDSPEEVQKRALFSVGWRVDPADSALLGFYNIGVNRLTVLRKGVPTNAAAEVPMRDYPEQVVLKRPLPWLGRARQAWVAGLGCVAAYLIMLTVLAAVGRRKTALGLLALFILLPAYGGALGFALVLAVLVAALLWDHRPWKAPLPPPGAGIAHWARWVAGIGLILLTVALPTSCVLVCFFQRYDPSWAVQGATWTYPVVLLPLCVLAVLGWKKTALGLLVPCLLLLLYVNWPLGGLVGFESGGSLLIFSLLEPRPPDPDAVRAAQSNLLTLLPYEAWDWSGWYWLWPLQLSCWYGPLAWALAMVGAAEFARWLRRNWAAIDKAWTVGPVNLGQLPKEVAAESRQAEEQQQQSQLPELGPP